MQPRRDSRIESATSAGLAAAVGIAREQGLPYLDPKVLSSRGNLLVHLAPAPVVARVATLTAWTRRDPFAWLAREVAVAGYAAARGGPVVAPTDLACAGPHLHDGFAVSLWAYLPPSARRPQPAEAGEALALLHLAVADFPGELPVMAPVTAQITEALAALERERVLDSDLLAVLKSYHEAVLAALGSGDGPAAVLHGDAHAGNLLHAGSGWQWIDLEETCRGPRDWDLAVLAGGRDAGGPAALAAYSAVTGAPVSEPEQLAPYHRARQLEGAVWTLGMAHQYPARYREPARTLLDNVLRDARSRLGAAGRPPGLRRPRHK